MFFLKQINMIEFSVMVLTGLWQVVIHQTHPLEECVWASGPGTYSWPMGAGGALRHQRSFRISTQLKKSTSSLMIFLEVVFQRGVASGYQVA